MDESIRRLLTPHSIAVIGANDKNSYAGRYLKNLINNKYSGKIYPINPKRDEVFGIPCYKAIEDVTEPIDLATIVIKADLVMDMLRRCVEKKVGSVLIISAGFSEVDPIEGKNAENEMRRIARETGIRILGPNTTGLANVETSCWGCSVGTIGIDPLMNGNAALVSQSGSSGFGSLLNAAKDRAVGYKYIVTTGNEADLGLVDIVDAVLDQDDIHAVTAYIEGIKDIEHFIRVAQKARSLGKAFVCLKIGESAVGSRAAASHTASLTGNMEVFNAICRQYGILKAEDYSEAIELTKMSMMEKKLCGKRLCVFSQSGGVSGFTGDMLGKYGMEVPTFSKNTQQFIDSFLKGFGSPKNPVDLTGAHMRSEELFDIIRYIDNNESIDGYVLATNGSYTQMQNPIHATDLTEKPCFFAWSGSLYDDGLNAVRESGKYVGYSIPMVAREISKMYAYNTTAIGVAYDMCPIEFSSSASKGEFLNEAEAKSFLNLAGINTPKRTCLGNEPDFNKIEAGKYVMKIVSSTIIHKTDMGGVKVDLCEKDIPKAYQELSELKKKNDDIEDIMIEEMAPKGLDLVLGVRKDATYGWTVVIGIGGVYTELFKLVSMRSVPASKETIDNMIDEVPGLSKLLSGYRGDTGYDKKALTETICRLCALAWQNKEKLSLIEINPLRVMPQNGGVLALDCVVQV